MRVFRKYYCIYRWAKSLSTLLKSYTIDIHWIGVNLRTTGEVPRCFQSVKLTTPHLEIATIRVFLSHNSKEKLYFLTLTFSRLFISINNRIFPPNTPISILSPLLCEAANSSPAGLTVLNRIDKCSTWYVVLAGIFTSTFCVPLKYKTGKTMQTKHHLVRQHFLRYFLISGNIIFSK
jgi:hypothetical protein